MESLKCVAEEGGTFLPKNWPPENTDLLETKKRVIQNFTVSNAPVLNIDDVITIKYEM